MFFYISTYKFQNYAQRLFTSVYLLFIEMILIAFRWSRIILFCLHFEKIHKESLDLPFTVHVYI